MTTAEPVAFTRNIPWPSNPDHRRGNWTDDPCFYVDCVEGEKVAMLAGPYATHAEALAALPAVKIVAQQVDARAHWYAFGTCRTPNGWREGVLNHTLGI